MVSLHLGVILVVCVCYVTANTTPPQGCVRNGVHYHYGQKFKPNACDFCTCESTGRVNCLIGDCFYVPCVDSVSDPNKCCPQCPNATLLQKKTRCVKMGKEEILLILRAYQSHPTSWSEVLEEIKDNLQLLPTNAADLYRSATLKKLRDRMSVKFGKLISAELISIKDLEIRNEVSKIKSNERRLVQRSVNTAPAPPAPAPAPLAPAPAPPAPAPPAPAQPAPAPPAPAPPVDRRDALVRGLSDSDDQQRPVDADEVVERHNCKHTDGTIIKQGEVYKPDAYTTCECPQNLFMSYAGAPAICARHTIPSTTSTTVAPPTPPTPTPSVVS